MKRTVKSLIKAKKPMRYFHLYGFISFSFAFYICETLGATILVSLLLYFGATNIVCWLLTVAKKKIYTFDSTKEFDSQELYNLISKETIYDIIPVSYKDNELIFAPHHKVQHTIFIDQVHGTLVVDTTAKAIMGYKYSTTSGEYLGDLAISCIKQLQNRSTVVSDASSGNINLNS